MLRKVKALPRGTLPRCGVGILILVAKVPPFVASENQKGSLPRSPRLC
jgi:hypothetical protein